MHKEETLEAKLDTFASGLDALDARLENLKRRVAQSCVYYIPVSEEDVIEENVVAAYRMLSLACEDLGLEDSEISLRWFRPELPSEQRERESRPPETWGEGRTTSLGRVMGNVSPLRPNEIMVDATQWRTTLAETVAHECRHLWQLREGAPLDEGGANRYGLSMLKVFLEEPASPPIS